MSYEKLTFEDGSVYEGETADGKPNGKGKLTSLNGRIIYEGEWIGYQYHGKGKLFYADGEYYKGDWSHVQNTPRGHFASAGDIYEGDFSYSLPNGKGKFTFANGEVYEGGFIRGTFTDKGKMIYANGDIYEGDFSYNLPNRKGKFIYANGDIYEGEVSKGRPYGKGKMIYLNGEVKEGNWKKNGEIRTKEIFLDWENYIEIAMALNKLYPNASPEVMSDSELIEKVTALPDFDGEKQPENDTYLSFISYKWILIKHGSKNYVRDPRDTCP